MRSEKDVFDAIAERIVRSHPVSKGAQPGLTRHIASELRQADHRARHDLRRDLRALLDVPSTEDLIDRQLTAIDD